VQRLAGVAELRVSLLPYAGEREALTTYSTLALVVGGVIVASGVEPSLNMFGAAICFLGAAFRGLRAVMQVCFRQEVLMHIPLHAEVHTPVLSMLCSSHRLSM
jgi:hypothetical protein